MNLGHILLAAFGFTLASSSSGSGDRIDSGSPQPRKAPVSPIMNPNPSRTQSPNSRQPVHACVALLLAMVAMLAHRATAQGNWLVNGGAEAGLSGWTVPPISNNYFNVSAAYVHGGLQSFTGGALTPPVIGAWTNELRQDVDLSSLSVPIDMGLVTSAFTGFGQSNSDGVNHDLGQVDLEFLGVNGQALATYSTGSFSPYNSWQSFSDTRSIPSGTRTARVRLRGTRAVGGSTDCFFDDMVLTISAVGVPYGAGTPSGSGPAAPALSCTALPYLGQTATLVVAQNDSSALMLMAAGLGRASIPSPFGTLLVANIVLTEVMNGGSAVGPGNYAYTLAIPNNPSLIGFRIDWQNVNLTATSFAMSNANEFWLSR